MKVSREKENRYTCSGVRVAVEPTLQPVHTTSEHLHGASAANTQDAARLDIVANGFWGGTYERAFYDVRAHLHVLIGIPASPVPTGSMKTLIKR